MSTVIAVAIVSVGSYGLRCWPLSRTRGRPVGTRGQHVLDTGAIAAIAALLVQDVATSRTSDVRLGMLVALVAAGALAVKGRSMGVQIVVGMIAYALATHLL